MNIAIKYNDKEDEFSNDLNLEMRLENYIKKHFYPAKVISMLSKTYLVGGAIRDLMFAKKPKDLDFVVLGHDKEWILEVFEKFKIVPEYNRFGGYKFTYQGTTIDLWLSSDLFQAIQYNVDGLLFDVGTTSLISLTFNDFQSNGIRLVNPENNIGNGREKKLIKFEETLKDE